jgi:hypothetical protein
MKKHMQKSSTEFKPEDKIVHMDIDCGAAEATAYCQSHSVQGYPTIKLLKPDGTEQKYDGGRTYSEITSFLKPFAGGAASSTDGGFSKDSSDDEEAPRHEDL